MIEVVLRTALLYFFMILIIRVMGKRQVGQLQPGELVITIMISEIATSPIENSDASMFQAVIPVAVLAVLEIAVSFASLKIIRLRELLQGHAVVIIRDGIPDRKQLSRLRYSMDDLLESLRQKDVFDIRDVQYAIAETDGSLSVMLKPEKRNATVSDVNAEPETGGLPRTIISDGRMISSQLERSSLKEKDVERILKKHKVTRKNVLLLTVDDNGSINLIKQPDRGKKNL